MKEVLVIFLVLSGDNGVSDTSVNLLEDHCRWNRAVVVEPFITLLPEQINCSLAYHSFESKRDLLRIREKP